MTQDYIPPNITLGKSIGHYFNATHENLEAIERKLIERSIQIDPNKDLCKYEFLNVPVNDKGEYIHELYIDTNTGVPASESKHMLIVHGFGASLGFFYRNLNDFKTLEGYKIHLIDLFGFGLSSRASFPKFNKHMSKFDDIKQVESFFVDPIEAWRQERKIDKFVLIGHSLGGYLSFCYTLEHPDRVEKLLLVSPVGVERSISSATLNLAQNEIETKIAHELAADHIQEKDLHSSSKGTEEFEATEDVGKVTEEQVAHEVSVVHNKFIDSLPEGEKPEGKNNLNKVVKYIWENHLVSPLVFARFSGIFGSKLIFGWSKKRFKGTITTDDEFMLMHKYVYFSIVACKKSGEQCITRLLAPGTVAYFPILDKIPQSLDVIEHNEYYTKYYGNGKRSVLNGIPVYFMYGDRDWMQKIPGKAASDRLNLLRSDGKNECKFKIFENAGHHVYLDNPKDFIAELKSFIA